MSAASRKGYAGEKPVLDLLVALQMASVYRPRAGTHRDVGDLGGIPIVVSVKNHRDLRLAEWVDDLEEMVARTAFGTGIVWHKRLRQGNPRRWYVTTSGGLFLPLLGAWTEKWEREHG